MADRFEDHRGLIEDLIDGPIDSVTRIYTAAGAVRGNHTHNETVQWTYIVSGTMVVVTKEPNCRPVRTIRTAGYLFCEKPGVAHAWQAIEPSVCLVFTRGPRSGANYESDTQRLEVPLLW